MLYVVLDQAVKASCWRLEAHQHTKLRIDSQSQGLVV